MRFWFAALLCAGLLAPSHTLRFFKPIEAFATILLDPDSGGLLDLSTTSGKANYTRFLYFLVNGPSLGYAIRGPEKGFLAIVNEITGLDGLGAAVRNAGFSDCTSISAGAATTFTGGDGASYQVSFTAASGRTIPSHFPDQATEAFTKRIQATRNGIDYLNVELRCDASSDVTTGYLRLNTFAADGTDGRQFETYFQTNAFTRSRAVDLFMSYPASGDGEKLAARLLSPDGNEYRLAVLRTRTTGGNSVGISVHGKKNQTLMSFRALETNDLNDSSSLGAQTEYCIQLGSNQISTECSTHNLSASTPATSTSVNGSPFTWTIDATNDLVLSGF